MGDHRESVFSAVYPSLKDEKEKEGKPEWRSGCEEINVRKAFGRKTGPTLCGCDRVDLCEKKQTSEALRRSPPPFYEARRTAAIGEGKVLSRRKPFHASFWPSHQFLRVSSYYFVASHDDPPIKGHCVIDRSGIPYFCVI